MTPHLSYKSYRLVRILLLSPAIFVQFPFKDTINDRMRERYGSENNGYEPRGYVSYVLQFGLLFRGIPRKNVEKRLR